jgi:NAD(P) transhydrogenase subunit alpha
MTDPFLINLFIFVLACFVGFEVISKVPTTLHTPLMSGANAISGITIVGALAVAGFATDLIPGGQGELWATILGFIAIIMATINVVGGFAVTDRMLEMFKKKDDQ